MYDAAIFAHVSYVCLTYCSEAEKSHELLDKLGAVCSVEYIITSSMIELDFILSIFRDIDIDVAESVKVFGRESSEVY